MSLDDRLRDELRRAATTSPLNSDAALAGVRAAHRRCQRRRNGKTAIATVVVLALAVTAFLASSRTGPSRHDRDLARELVKVPRDATVARATLARASGGGDVSAVAHTNSEFALDLYGALRNQSGNLIFSPQSLATVLAMTSVGANGPTATEIADVLHSTVSATELARQFNALAQQLLAPRQAPAGAGTPLELHINDSLWAQAGYPFYRTFLDTLARYYGAGVNLVDFIHDADSARMAINHTVNTQTNGQIPELLPPGILDTLTRLVLIDVITFDGAWRTPFKLASAQPFHRLDGTTISAPTMTLHGSPLFHTDGYDAARIPYVGGASMTLIVPTGGNFDGVEHRLGPALAQARAALPSRPDAPVGAYEHLGRVDLTMPTFRFSSQLDLNNTLQQLGMRTAFIPPTPTTGADFSNLSPGRKLYVKNVLQDATISVDEHGTKAAAATAAVIEAEAGYSEFKIDRPFIFAITDDTTGAILFIGRVTDPTRS
jgi:serpin B